MNPSPPVQHDKSSSTTKLCRPGASLLVMAAGLTLQAWCSAGCTTAGALAHKFVGPPPVPAMYKPAREPMLVLVEHYRNPSAVVVDAQRLSGVIGEQLRRYDIAPVVDPGKLEAVRADPGYAEMSIPAVGRAAGAKQVLYVNVRRIAVESTVGGETIKGAADLTVRVVDCATGNNRWPIDAGGHPISVATPWLARGEGANESTLREQMGRSAADAIGKLFRKYSIEHQDADMSAR